MRLSAHLPNMHDLKIDPQYFEAVKAGIKRAELRYNDRNFKAGDYLALHEYDREKGEYTGRIHHARITHVCDVDEWLSGYVMLSIDIDF